MWRLQVNAGTFLGPTGGFHMLRTLSRSAISFVLTAAACGTTQSRATPPSQEPPATPATQAADPNVDAATVAAQSWLALIDEEKYSESWSAAAATFQSALSDANWGSSVSRVRGPLGKVLSRQIKSAKFKTSLPGAPDGKYVVIQFSTAFAKKAAAVETVTPVQESDGTWKVAGYFIK
jgi:hypothetical protein